MTIDDLYVPGPISEDDVAALLDTSLGPRGPDWLYDLAAELGVGGESVVPAAPPANSCGPPGCCGTGSTCWGSSAGAPTKSSSATASTAFSR